MRLAVYTGVAFAVTTIAVAVGLTRTADRALLDTAQVAASPAMDVASSLLSALGGVVVTTIVALALIIVDVRRMGLAALTPLLMFVGVAVEWISKRVLMHPAPPIDLLRDYHWLAIGGPEGAAGNAYPSGHMTRTAFLVVLVAARWPATSWVTVPLLAAMAFTRVYSASHWTSDVVGGILLGAALAGLAASIAKSRTA